MLSISVAKYRPHRPHRSHGADFQGLHAGGTIVGVSTASGSLSSASASTDRVSPA
jgi:hypothetical protein